MSLAKYIIVMMAGTLLSFGSWVYVLFNINPQETNTLGFVFFYASLGLALIGFFSLVGFGLRKVVIRKEVDFRHVYISFRQAIFISFILVVVLLLQSQRLFTWLNAIFLVVTLVALELFIISRRVEECKE